MGRGRAALKLLGWQVPSSPGRYYIGIKSIILFLKDIILLVFSYPSHHERGPLLLPRHNKFTVGWNWK